MKNQLNDGSFPILNSGTVKELKEKVKNIGKPSIFIGSSKESLDVAKKVQSSFPKEQFQVDIWSDGIFGKTKSSGGRMANMEWLKNFTDIYDFAIFIFVPDDQIISLTRHDMADGKARKAIAVRHNVIFEFGMFLGRIGAKRSFILFDKDVKPFVDLFFTDLKENLDDEKMVIEVNSEFRIEIQSYIGNYTEYLKDKKNVLPYKEKSINNAIGKITKKIIKTFNEVEINFLPATSLAFGYFNNFIDIFVKNLEVLKTKEPYPENWVTKEKSDLNLDELRKIAQNTKKLKLKVVIPTSVEGARQENFTPHFDKKKFQQINFPGSNRSITLLTKNRIEKQNHDEWIIYDVPTTLNSTIEAIELLTEHKDIRELLKEKELRNFRKSLEYKSKKASKDAKTKNIKEYIEFISYDQFQEETK